MATDSSCDRTLDSCQCHCDFTLDVSLDSVDDVTLDSVDDVTLDSNTGTVCIVSEDETREPSLIRQHSTPLKNKTPTLCSPFHSVSPTSFYSSTYMKCGSESWDVLRVVDMNCCSTEQAQQAHLITPGEIGFFHKNFNSRSHLSQNQWIIDYMNSNCSRHCDVPSFNFIVCGKPVCQKLWLSILNVSLSRFYRLRSLYLDGKVCLEVSQLKRSVSVKSNEAIAWMGNYFDRIGDQLPDKLVIHLPSSLTRRAVYERMREEMNVITSCVSLPQFYNLWKEVYPQVSIPSENRFAKCDTCCVLKDEKTKTVDAERRKALQSLLDKHLELQSQERQYYYRHRDLAQRNKRDCLSIIIDGMDQSKTNLPHFARERKSSSTLWRLRTHITGAITHGYGVCCYIDMMIWPHDSNLTINTLVDVLSKRDILPPTLYLQLDNTARENKNQYVLAFLAYLVQAGVFSEIHLSFLMVGHTHEDIDQVFSRVSTYLKKNSVYTLEDLEQAVYNSNQEVVSVAQFKQILDYKSWLLPYIVTPHRHTIPHNFLFRLGSGGKVVMLYRNWSSDNWLPSAPDEGIVILKDKPPVQPSAVKGSLDKLDVKKLFSDVKKYSSCGVPQDKMSFWISLEDKLTELAKKSLTETEQYQSPLELLLRKERRSTAQKVTVEIPDIVSNALEKDTLPIPEVYTGNRKRSAKEALTSDSKKKRSKSGKTARHSNQVSTVQSQDCTEKTESSSSSVIGKCVAVLTENEEDAPWIARVTGTCDDGVEVVWMEGSYVGQWKVATIKRGRRHIEWKDKVLDDSIIMYGLNLTDTNCLDKDTVDGLKKLYKQCFECNDN